MLWFETYLVSEQRLEGQRSRVKPPQGIPARSSETTCVQKQTLTAQLSLNAEALHSTFH